MRGVNSLSPKEHSALRYTSGLDIASPDLHPSTGRGTFASAFANWDLRAVAHPETPPPKKSVPNEHQTPRWCLSVLKLQVSFSRCYAGAQFYAHYTLWHQKIRTIYWPPQNNE